MMVGGNRGFGGAKTTMSMSFPGSMTVNVATNHCLLVSSWGRMLRETVFASTVPYGGCFAPVMICFAVIQYSRPSTSTEKIVPASLSAFTKKVLNRMLLVTVGDCGVDDGEYTSHEIRTAMVSIGRIGISSFAARFASPAHSTINPLI